MWLFKHVNVSFASGDCDVPNLCHYSNMLYGKNMMLSLNGIGNRFLVSSLYLWKNVMYVHSMNACFCPFQWTISMKHSCHICSTMSLHFLAGLIIR